MPARAAGVRPSRLTEPFFEVLNASNPLFLSKIDKQHSCEPRLVGKAPDYSGVRQRLDVLHLKDVLRIALQHAIDHGQAHFLHGAGETRHEQCEDRNEAPHPPFGIALAGTDAHDAWPE